MSKLRRQPPIPRAASKLEIPQFAQPSAQGRLSRRCGALERLVRSEELNDATDGKGPST